MEMEMGQKNKSYGIPIAIVLASIIIAGAILIRVDTGKKDEIVNSKNNGVAESGSVVIDEDDDFVLGDPSATVTFVAFGDFRCRYCGLFQKQIKPIIMEKYVKTGKIKYVYRDFITMGENSILAAGGANCAGEQDKYWDFSEALHGKGPGFTHTKESLSGIALSLGLNIDSFKQCLELGKYVDEIQKDTEDAIRAGANGTPAVFINNRLISGLNPIEEYERVIEEELAK